MGTLFEKSRNYWYRWNFKHSCKYGYSKWQFIFPLIAFRVDNVAQLWAKLRQAEKIENRKK